MNHKKITALIAVMSAMVLSSCSEQSAETIPKDSGSMQTKLNLDTTSITVSGISSGGYMANQYHTAFSKQVNGAALLASGPFGCAQGDLKIALSQCMNVSEDLNIEPLYKNMLSAVEHKTIDSVSHLEGDNVWIFHGQSDRTVSRKVVDAQLALYQKLNANIKYQVDSKVGHGFPTLDYGVECAETKSPFINHCSLDATSQFLSFLYPKAENKNTVSQESNGEIIEFEQAQFLAKGENNTLADKGYLFIPSSCLSGERCQLHVAFHGCQQNVETIGKVFIQETGINRWASENHLVVLYPQTKSTYMPLNPKACWDWWGYTGADYLTQSGAQLKHVNSMVRDLSKILN
jgi:poly(3-hydroxybutyrate) depolymerase